jgi:hypothetical protein
MYKGFCCQRATSNYGSNYLEVNVLDATEEALDSASPAKVIADADRRLARSSELCDQPRQGFVKRATAKWKRVY